MQKKELEKKGKKVPQSVAEKFFCNELSQLDKDAHYSGFIHIQESPQMRCIADGTNEIGGTVIPPDIIEAFRKSFITLELTEAREIDDKIMDSISTKGSFGGYKKTETEADKLNARLAFIYEQYNLAFKDLEIKCLHDVLTLMMSEKPNTNTESAELWNLIIQVIGK
ncbi:MAG: hypothetical protein QNJ51_03080 [Calothrix sp. MO_167.B12]|nr:hypothetical protein [Calothrix sp. MO_167.B12]